MRVVYVVMCVSQSDDGLLVQQIAADAFEERWEAEHEIVKLLKDDPRGEYIITDLYLNELPEDLVEEDD